MFKTAADAARVIVPPALARGLSKSGADSASNATRAPALHLPKVTSALPATVSFHSHWIRPDRPIPLDERTATPSPAWFREQLKFTSVPAAKPDVPAIALTPRQKQIFDTALLAISSTRALITPANQLDIAYKTRFEATARLARNADVRDKSAAERLDLAIKSGAGNCIDMAICTYEMLCADPAMKDAHIRIVTSKELDHALVVIDDVVADAWDPSGVPYLAKQGNPSFDIVQNRRPKDLAEKPPGLVRGDYKELVERYSSQLRERRNFPGDSIAYLQEPYGENLVEILSSKPQLVDVNSITPTTQGYTVGGASQEVFGYGYFYPPSVTTAQVTLQPRSFSSPGAGTDKRT